jgi:hypothetical protein
LKIIEIEGQKQHEEENMNSAEMYPLEDVKLTVVLTRERER